MKNHNRIISDESAQGLVEYSLILSLIVFIAIATVIIFGESVFNLYETIKNDVINTL